ncbi:MAG: hypothetical protein Fur0022_19390 [Anaerolineales bacterium]
MVHLTQAGEGTLGQVAASPDGHTLAIAGSSGIWLFDKFQLEPLTQITGHAGKVNGVSWSPDGAHLVSGGDDKTVRVWDVTAFLAGTGPVKQVHLLIAHTQQVNAVAWSSNPTLVASAGEDGQVWIWELSKTQQGEADARFVHQLAHATAVYDLAWHPNGRYLATASLDSTLDLWDTTLGLNLATLEGHESWATTLAWNPAGNILASGATDRTLRLWDITFNTPTNPAAKPTVRVAERAIIQTLYNPNAMVWTPDGTQIAAGGASPFTINFWDIAPSKNLEEAELRPAVRTLAGHFAPVTGLAFAPGGVLISTGADTTLRVWKLTTGEEIRRFSPLAHPTTSTPFTAPIQALSWAPDGSHLVTAHSDYTLRVWQTDGTTLTQTHVLTGHQNIINSVDWSANGNWIASGSTDSTTRVWDSQTGQLLYTLASEGAKINAVAFAPFGNQLATGGLVRIAQIWEVGTDQAPILLTTNSEITQIAWAPNGTLLALGGSDGTLTIWDVPAASQLLLLTGEHNNAITGISWAPDGTRLATLDNLGKLVLWNTSNGLPIIETTLGGNRWTGLAWSPNSQLLATANANLLYLLDAETAQPLHLLTGHTGEIREIEWKPDGSQLATAGQDSTLHLWAMPSPTLPHAEVLAPSQELPASAQTLSGIPITLENAAQVQAITQLGHGTALHLAPHPNGRMVAVAGGIGTWVYDATTWTPLRLLTGNKTYAAAWSPDGSLLATRELSSILIWDVEREQVLRVFGVDIGVWPNFAWSSDGTMLAAGNFRGFVCIFTLATGEILYEWQPGRDITSIAWAPDGKTLAAGGTAPDSDVGLVWLWDIPTGQAVNVLEAHSARVTHLAWSPDGTKLLSAGDDLALNLWDVTTLELPPAPAEREEMVFPPLTGQTLTAEALTDVRALAWSPDGRLFMSADATGSLQFWGAESGLIQAFLTTSPTGLLHAAWGNNTLFTLHNNGYIQAWDAATNRQLSIATSHTAEIRLVQWAATENQIFTAGADGTLQQFGLDETLVQTHTLGYLPSGMTFFANSGLFAARSQDGTVEVFQFGGGGASRIISQGTGEPDTDWWVDWSDDGEFLAWNQTREGTTLIEVMGFASNESFSLSGAETKVTALSWSPDAATDPNPRRGPTHTFRLAAGTEDGKVIVWDVLTERVLRTIQAYSGRVRVIAWAPDGTTFATGGTDGQDNDGFQYVRIWNARTGQLVRELQLPFGHEAQALAWSPDGTLLASGDSFGEVLLWNPKTGGLVGTMQGHQQAVVSLDWSRANNAIVSGSRDGTVRVWGIEEE